MLQKATLDSKVKTGAAVRRLQGTVFRVIQPLIRSSLWKLVPHLSPITHFESTIIMAPVETEYYDLVGLLSYHISHVIYFTTASSSRGRRWYWPKEGLSKASHQSEGSLRQFIGLLPKYYSSIRTKTLHQKPRKRSKVRNSSWHTDTGGFGWFLVSYRNKVIGRADHYESWLIFVQQSIPSSIRSCIVHIHCTSWNYLTSA